MKRWLVPPQRGDEYETFAARVLHYTLLLLMAVALLYMGFISSAAQFIFIPLVLALFVTCYYLLHTGRFRLACIIFLSGLWIIITAACFGLNGIRNASVSAYAIVIIYSAVLLSSQSAVVFTVLSILSILILTLGEVWGVLPLRSTPLYLPDRFFQQTALFGAAGILLAAASRVIRDSFQRIQQSEEKYRLLFENTPVMAAVYKTNGEIVLLNKAAAQMLGGTPETLQGRSVHDVLVPEDAAGALQDHAKVIEEGTAMLEEGRITLPSGRELYYLRHVMPLPEMNDPGSAQVLVLTTDMTEKHLAEQREHELALAEERNAFLTDFFSTLSHDLKTPLSIINTSLHLLRRAETIQQQELRMALISDQVVLMDQYLQDMLTISRLEHLPALEIQQVHLGLLVENVVDSLRPRIEHKQLVCKLSVTPDLPAVRGDLEQLRRMFTNLIENAINYTPFGGQISVTTGSIGGQVTVEIHDTGIGIEAEALPQVFERFFRAPNAKVTGVNGTGLGLAIVKKVVDIHSATIELHSQVGEGTRICIRFPAAPAP